MKKNKALTNIRISTELYDLMLKAISRMNLDSDIEFSLGDFRRLAYRHFSQHILEKGLDFNVKVE